MNAAEDPSSQRLALSRRTFIRAAGAGGLGFVLFSRMPDGVARALAPVPGRVIEAAAIPKFVTELPIPTVMPRSHVAGNGAEEVDCYAISLRQLCQQILPEGLPRTTVWGYGPDRLGTRADAGEHHAPSATIEARWERPVRITWTNALVDGHGHYLPHLLPVDPTLLWANPPGGVTGRDSRPEFSATPGSYRGPVPMVPHLHGAVGVGDESDGYAEAWFLPAARDLPPGYAVEGSWYEFFARKATRIFGGRWRAGSATFQYPNTGRAGTQWYHDHALGLTRTNVYAGPAGFYLLRGGPQDRVLDSRTGHRAVLPGPAPREGDPTPPTTPYREIPVVIQDRAFNEDGSLFYPDSRVLFDGIAGDYLPAGPFPPIWTPEFFGNTIVVNGRTWPYLTVEQCRYRLRLLNGCQSRFLVLDLGRVPGIRVWQIGSDGGFLPSPVDLGGASHRVLLAPAERADVIVDFAGVPTGRHVLHNIGPDQPFTGRRADARVPRSDPASTGQVLQFQVVPATGPDRSTPPEFLALPRKSRLPRPTRRRRLALLEVMAAGHDAAGKPVQGPTTVLLGQVDRRGRARAKGWSDPVTENPMPGDTEIWEFYNTTADAHPIHLHEVLFEVVDRQALAVAADRTAIQPLRLVGPVLPPEPGENGFKDTVVAFPGRVTRVRVEFATAGQYMWHCHLIEHEDNEMMRPYRIGPVQPGQPG